MVETELGQRLALCPSHHDFGEDDVSAVVCQQFLSLKGLLCSLSLGYILAKNYPPPISPLVEYQGCTTLFSSQHVGRVQDLPGHFIGITVYGLKVFPDPHRIRFSFFARR